MARNARLLLVDDDHDYSEALEVSLTSQGIDVVRASSGLEAFTMLLDGTASVDVVLSDVQMDPWSGIELSVRVTARFPGLPILLMTGNPKNPEIPQDLGGAKGIITKPFTTSNLGDIIRSLANDTFNSPSKSRVPT